MTLEAIKVSALISLYNAERFIEGRIADLAAQTLWTRGALELIFINSGSRQNEEAIIFNFWRSLPSALQERVTYIKTAREPLYSAWNRGIRLARGMYLTNANADDRLRPDAIEQLAAALDNAPPDVAGVYGDCYVTRTPNARWDGAYELDYPSYYPCGFTDWEQATPEVMVERCVVGNCPLWRRAMHDLCGLFDQSYLLAGDYEMWLRAMAHGLRFVKIEGEPLGLFYHAPEQQSQIALQQIIMETRRAQLQWANAILERARRDAEPNNTRAS